MASYKISAVHIKPKANVRDHSGRTSPLKKTGRHLILILGNQPDHL